MVKFIHVDRCDSTQDLLKEQLTQNSQEDLVVSCEYQNEGRGRGSNKFQDSPGTICFSMTMAPHLQASFSALEISVLVARFFENKNRKLNLKWPNDLLNQENKKCAGILVQNSAGLMMAGIGLNLFLENSEFGGVYEAPFELSKRAWVQELSHYLHSYRYSDTQLLIDDWITRCWHLNKLVSITEGEEVVTGVFKGIGQYGEALLQNDQGIHHLYNGSLRLV